jgi:hypothetical protein
MKTKNSLFKRVFVLITILLSFGLSRISAQVIDPTTFNFKINDGSFKNLYIKDFKTMVSDASHSHLIAYTQQGDFIADIVGFTFSNDAVEVKVPNSAVNGFSIYPNPSDGNFTVKADLKTTNDVCFQLFSMTGQVVKNVILANQPNDFVYEFNQNLAHGVYICRLKAGINVLTEKVIIK